MSTIYCSKRNQQGKTKENTKVQLNTLGGLGTAGIGSFTSDLFSWREKKLNKLDHNKLFSFNGASDKAGGVRKQNQSDSLAASAGDGKQKTPLNKHTGRYLASTEGRLESNRQGMVPELLEDSYISWIVVLVRRAHQLKWSNSTQKPLKLQMRANLFCT